MNLTVGGDNERRSFKRIEELAELGSNQSFCKNTSDEDKCYNNKEKTKKVKAYIPGGFSISVVTDNIENTRSYYEHEILEINRNHTDTEVLIFFY